MGALRWVLAAGTVVSAVVGVWFWHYAELAREGRIPISPEPSGDGEHPVGTYTAGVVVCGVVAVVCLVLLLAGFVIGLVPDRHRSTPDARPPRRVPTRSPRRLRPGGTAGPLPSDSVRERRGLRRPTRRT